MPNVSVNKNYSGPESVEEFFERDALTEGEVDLIDDASAVREIVEKEYLREIDIAKFVLPYYQYLTTIWN